MDYPPKILQDYTSKSVEAIRGHTMRWNVTNLFPLPIEKRKKLEVVEARGYVRNPKGCASPVVNPEGFPSGRHIHSLVGSIIGFNYRIKKI
jgi:hypothetical protein